MEEIEKRVDALEKEHVRTGEQIKTLFNRQDEIKGLMSSIQKMTISLELLAKAQQATEVKVGKMSSDIDEIKSKPAKRWDSVTNLALTAIVTALMTLILTGIGLK